MRLERQPFPRVAPRHLNVRFAALLESPIVHELRHLATSAEVSDDALVHGPRIVAATLSKPNVVDRYGNRWPYHSRSDHHSKVCCWVVLFDLMRHCALMRSHAASGAIGFGINHEIVDFKHNRKKNFDLVLCTPRTSDVRPTLARFRDLVAKYDIVLNAEDLADLDSLPNLLTTPVGSVQVAFEAKACMTEHNKARPRLYDELNSSHLTVHGSSDVAIAAGFVMVNASTEFISPDLNKKRLRRAGAVVSTHRQPEVTVRVMEKIRELPRRTAVGETGFDALGIVVVAARNDGSPVSVVHEYPAPPPGDIHDYESMIRRAAQSYEARFSRI